MKIFLLGASNPESIRIIRAIERSRPNVAFSGFLDNDSSKWGSTFFGLPVIGGVEEVPRLAAPNVGFASLVTRSTLERYETGRALVDNGGTLVNVIHPDVDTSMTSWGVGNYIQNGVIVQAGVAVGHNSSIHMSAVVGHESTIGSSVFIAHAVSISGKCTIEDGVFLGTNATVLPRTRIGRWAVVGAGSVVTRDVPEGAVVVGNPARVVRFVEPKYVDGSSGL